MMCFFCGLQAMYPKGFYFPVFPVPGITAEDRFNDIEKQIDDLAHGDETCKLCGRRGWFVHNGRCLAGHGCQAKGSR